MERRNTRTFKKLIKFLPWSECSFCYICRLYKYPFIPYPLRTLYSHAFCQLLIETSCNCFNRGFSDVSWARRLPTWQAWGARNFISAKALLSQSPLRTGRCSTPLKWGKSKIVLSIFHYPSRIQPVVTHSKPLHVAPMYWHEKSQVKPAEKPSSRSHTELWNIINGSKSLLLEWFATQ